MPRTHHSLSPHPVDTHVGLRIRARRLQINMSQTKLAKICDITFQQVQKYESGRNRVSASRVSQIAAALGTDVPYLFCDAPNGGDPASLSRSDPSDSAYALAATPDGQALAKLWPHLSRDFRRILLNLAREIVQTQQPRRTPE